MAKETLPWGPSEWKWLHWKMNDVTKSSQGQIVEVAKDNREKIEWAVFEKINLLSWIDEEKLAELQKADLVLVYRDNNTYKDMSSSLEDLVLNKHGWKVYCISIPQGTKELSDGNVEILRRIMGTCHSMIDWTTSRWVRIRWRRIPEEESQDVKNFLWIAKSLEKKFIKKWIDTVYLFEWMQYDGKSYFNLLEHSWLCQREDGSIYKSTWNWFIEERYFNSYSQEIEDAKRFWEKLFPNLKVEFVIGRTNWLESWFKYNKAKGAVMIVDRHYYDYCEDFKEDGWKVIVFVWADFEPWGWIEEFLDGSEYGWNGKLIAKLIMLDAFGNGDNLQE